MLSRRAVLALALGLAIVLAGCAADDPPRESPPTTTTPPPDEAPPTSPPTSSPADNGTADNDTEEASPDAAPEPMEVYNGSHDFTSPPADPTKAEREPFAVGEGHSQVTMTVRYTSKTGDLPVTLTNSMDIRLAAPDGTSDGCGLSQPQCERTLPAQAGEWAVEYTGQGNYEVHVTVVAS